MGIRSNENDEGGQREKSENVFVINMDHGRHLFNHVP